VGEQAAAVEGLRRVTARAEDDVAVTRDGATVPAIFENASRLMAITRTTVRARTLTW